jgi:hypothetical protein
MSSFIHFAPQNTDDMYQQKQAMLLLEIDFLSFVRFFGRYIPEFLRKDHRAKFEPHEVDYFVQETMTYSNLDFDPEDLQLDYVFNYLYDAQNFEVFELLYSQRAAQIEHALGTQITPDVCKYIFKQYLECNFTPNIIFQHPALRQEINHSTFKLGISLQMFDTQVMSLTDFYQQFQAATSEFLSYLNFIGLASVLRVPKITSDHLQFAMVDLGFIL